jgi:hypothetical protein
MKALNWIIALAGLLAVIAPFVLGFSTMTAMLWSNLIVGILLIIFGVWAAVSDRMSTDRTLDWINAILGLWLLISPFVLGGSAVMAALWSDVVLGIVALVLGVVAALRENRMVAR